MPHGALGVIRRQTVGLVRRNEHDFEWPLALPKTARGPATGNVGVPPLVLVCAVRRRLKRLEVRLPGGRSRHFEERSEGTPGGLNTSEASLLGRPLPEMEVAEEKWMR